jgi:hypothetical protein
MVDSNAAADAEPGVGDLAANGRRDLLTRLS